MMGPKKKELALPCGCKPWSLLLSRDNLGQPLPNVVPCFKACMGVPLNQTSERGIIYYGGHRAGS
jgi:hypothetical protein